MIDVAIFGFGVVGSGCAEVLTKNARLIAERVGEEINVKYILDLREFPDSPFAGKVVHDINIILNDKDVKICAELMGGSHPAFEFSKKAMEAGKSVVTSNKEVVATFGPELLQTAKDNGVHYLFEASVGGGIPVIHPIGACLTANDITSVDGILNGTTNYILTQMINEHKSFDEALSEAQAKGYAEKDPSADVDGIDACRKTAILSAIAFGELVPPEKIPTQGICNITLDDVANAGKYNAAIKLIGHTARVNGKICAFVAPMLVKYSNPLANISDVYNGILVNGNAIGDVMFYGRGAGKLPTASAVVSDIIEIASGRTEHQTNVWTRVSDSETFSPDELISEFYVKMINGKAPENIISTELDGKNAFISVKITLSSLKAALEGSEYSVIRVM